MPEREEELRLFVACELSEELRRALGSLQDELRKRTGLRLRWVRPEGVHLTLKFLGGVPASRVEAITEALTKAVRPFELRLAPSELGTFGGRRPRVVWVGLEGDIDGLRALARRIDEALAALGFPAEQREFNGHLTLARVPDGASASERARLVDAVRDLRLPHLPAIHVRQAVLMQSVLGPKGSVYHRLAVFPPDGPP